MILIDTVKHSQNSKFFCKLISMLWTYKVMLLLMMGMIKHSQSTQSNKFAISLQFLKIENRDGFHFLHADKYTSFYKLAFSFLMEVV